MQVTALARSGFGRFSRWLLTAIITLLVIAYLTMFGLNMFYRGRVGLPYDTLNTAWESLKQTGEYVFTHPTTYTWHKVDYPVFDLVGRIFAQSAVLLVLSSVVAVAVGVPLGMAAALTRRKYGGPLIMVLSIVGVSTPSFMLGMFLWVINIQIYRLTGRPFLPQTGFGWDVHLVMPTLVLAMRPLAQVAQVTYVSLSEVLGEDYIRTARAKGLAERIVNRRHAMRNVLIPILTALGTSLRFSLASLPVVEFFFYWEGVGETLFEAIRQGNSALVTDLILSLGLLFLLINLVLDLIYPWLDPRLRDRVREQRERERLTWRQRWQRLLDTVRGWGEDFLIWIGNVVPGLRRRQALPPLQVQKGDAREAEARVPLEYRRSRWILRSIFLNPALLIGIVVVTGLIVVALLGEGWTEANPYETHGAMYIEGVISAAPFPPSELFPWGSDQLGRDVQALVLGGGKRTLTLALFGMLARLLVGTVLGLLAGWRRGSWFDRLVSGAIGVWAAFPFTLFAMIVIYALGIKQGMGVFVIAICVVGWGEVAQFVRGQVVRIKPQLFIDAAQSVGTPPGQILIRHVLPHLVAPLLVLAALEMGGVLMLLAELGFLGVFLGGGFQVDVTGVGAFSDVPEWGAQLANVRYWWRTYPWVAIAPGLAFSVAIVAFNVLGEGLRRFIQVGRINLGRIVNTYTVTATVVVVLALFLVLRSMSPMGIYHSQALDFDTQRAMEHIRVLSSEEMQGRETGTPGADRAVEYIAGQMKEIGLFPAGMNSTFVASAVAARLHVVGVPRMEILDEGGDVTEAFGYRQDFVEYAGRLHTYGEAGGAVVGLAAGPDPGVADGESYDLTPARLHDKIVLLKDEHAGRIGSQILTAAGVLIVVDDEDVDGTGVPDFLERRYLFSSSYGEYRATPTMLITRDVAGRLLAAAGSSMAALDEMAAGLEPGEVAVTGMGPLLHLETPTARGQLDEQYYAVIGFIAGSGAQEGLDDQVILVGAYYDGLGVGPDGTRYPGANDNASGVAVMLEVARALKNGPYEPKKTVVFVAWPGGERMEPLDVGTVMGAKPGFNLLTLEAVLEVSGVGAGTGNSIALGQGTSFRLVQMFQDAAGWVGVGATTRGRGPHVGREARDRREALSIYLSWDGSDRTAHTPWDTYESIDADKIKKVGQAVTLAVTVLSREESY